MYHPILKSISCILFFLSVLSAETSIAQILNIEKSRAENDSTRQLLSDIHLNLSIYNRSATNDEPVNYTGVNSQLNLLYISPKHSYLLLNSLNYLSINSSAFVSTAYAHARANFLRHRIISYELFAQGQYDTKRGLNYRFLSGSGLRFLLLKKDNITLTLGIGAMYENENWNNPMTEHTISVSTLKSANYLSTQIALKSYLDFNIVTYYQAGSQEDLLRHRVNTDTSLTVKVNQILSFHINFTAAYENEPIIPITKFIYSISQGIQIKIN